MESIEPKERNKAMDAFENPAELYRLWKEEGNILAGLFFANKHHWGDEANGIFINPKQAREIYEEIGEDFETWKKEEGENPNTVEYIIEGTKEELKAFKVLFDTLNSKFGTPDLFDGVYIPLGVFMKTLVGSPYYEGNVLTLEEEKPNKLILTAELDKPFALFYALREAFDNLKISSEIEKEESQKIDKIILLSLIDGGIIEMPGEYIDHREQFIEKFYPEIPKLINKGNQEEVFYIPFEKNGLYGYIDNKENVIIEPTFEFEDADVTFLGVSRVQKDGLYGYIRIPSGKWLKEPQFIDGYRSPNAYGFVEVTKP
ncbi:MAG: WG repeat-containing protein [Muribaculaceae bacterium]|nr:WG repeat-containing protein [Muribaculaceae bacterium]